MGHSDNQLAGDAHLARRHHAIPLTFERKQIAIASQTVLHSEKRETAIMPLVVPVPVAQHLLLLITSETA